MKGAGMKSKLVAAAAFAAVVSFGAVAHAEYSPESGERLYHEKLDFFLGDIFLKFQAVFQGGPQARRLPPEQVEGLRQRLVLQMQQMVNDKDFVAPSETGDRFRAALSHELAKCGVERMRMPKIEDIGLRAPAVFCNTFLSMNESMLKNPRFN
jgi:hypothetical protein